MEIWINPACSKCRTALSALDAAGQGYTVRNYLQDPPTAAELGEVLERLALEPWDIARDAEVRAAGIALPRDAANRSAWIAALVADPRTIQRPIITASDGTTAVARDPSTLSSLIAHEQATSTGLRPRDTQSTEAATKQTGPDPH